jgi:putative MATE family efflux protein
LELSSFGIRKEGPEWDEDQMEELQEQNVIKEQSLIRDLRDSFHGHLFDYTRGPVGRSIVLLAVPMILEMLMESIFMVVDVFFVARLGSDAVAVVGITESLITLVYSVGMGLGIGAMAMVSRRIGAGELEGAARVAVQALVIGLIVSITIGVPGALFAPQLLELMGASPVVVEQGSNYARIMLGSNIVIIFLFLINAIFRGAGDAMIAMRVLWLANLINIVLCPLLIFGPGPFPELGVTGAAVATAIGRGTGALYALLRLLGKRGRLSLKRDYLSFNRPLMMRLVRLSASGTFQLFIGMASWLGLVKILSGYGSAALAGYTIGLRVIIFTLLPSVGLSNAAATMVGQALGARDPERASKAVWLAAKYNATFLGLVGLSLFLFARQISECFTQDITVLGYSTDCLRIVSCGYVFYAYGMVLEQAFNGAGDTWTPTKINLFVFWLWEIPLAYVLAYRIGMGPRGVFWAILIAFSSLTLVSGFLFRRGGWKSRQV